MINDVTRSGGALEGVARRLGWTEGQLYTALISVTAGALLAWSAVPGALPTAPLSSAAMPAAVPGLPAPAGPVAEAPPVELSLPESVPLDGGPAFDPVPADQPVDAPVPAEPDAAPTTALPPAAPASAPAVAVSVLRAGYTSRGAGTALATAGVPEDAVAVANRAGLPDKLAYVQLVGTGPQLVLAVADDPVASRFESFAVLRLCPVVAKGYQLGRGDVDTASAPAYDCARSVLGERQADGAAWSFDISTFPTAVRQNGVVVLPAAAAAPDFQVSFRLPGVPGIGASGTAAPALAAGLPAAQDRRRQLPAL
jgi:hypothetical protein